MNGIFVVSTRNYPLMRNLSEFYEVPYLGYPTVTLPKWGLAAKGIRYSCSAPQNPPRQSFSQKFFLKISGP
ncbi:hypothetical protein Y032_0101g3378 [Ancylostoma ceylanicum]|uniref:Uncharacterized protein n=1 Tax=Ancylostoma ceylanicum TaxID=53326 RepID=A0A016THU4_9BILA|nr:hypothetical protein Y032_0101g3378 [Ancylostoma ceylanicum]